MTSPCRTHGERMAWEGHQLGGIDNPLIGGIATGFFVSREHFVMRIWRSLPWDGRANTTREGM